MSRGRSCALWATCLILIASGCAGPARRAGLAGGAGPASGGGGVMPRLLRPADPIARLSPAPVSFGGPRIDPGSYTPAAPAAVLATGGPVPVDGSLTVGGGQLTARRPSATAPPATNPTRGPLVARTARPESRAAERPRSPAPSLAASARAVDAGRDNPTRAPDAGRSVMPDSRRSAPASSPAARLAASGRGIAPASDRDRSPKIASTVVRPAAEDRSAAAAVVDREPEARRGPPPMLAAGIDLETYAAPPIASDPEAQLASGRRPIAVIRSNPTASEPEPAASKPEPEPEPEPIAPEPEEAPGLAPIPPVGDPIEGNVTRGRGSLPARDDIRPATVRPSSDDAEQVLRSDRSDDAIDPPTPFELVRSRSRILSRVRQFGQRLTRERAPTDPEPTPDASAGPAPRRPRLWGREDAEWLNPKR